MLWSGLLPTQSQAWFISEKNAKMAYVARCALGRSESSAGSLATTTTEPLGKYGWYR